MKKVDVASIGQTASVVGFGCASLGSRVSAKGGLLALQRAYDAGISWYDVAPSYGDGNAEAILGGFIGSRRKDVQVCTKVGIRPAPTPNYMRMVTPIVRAAVDAVPRLRTLVSRARPTATKIPLTPQMIETSIEESLRRLRTDHVDILALHGPSATEVVREDILAALQKTVRDGKALTIGIAGDVDAGLAGLFRGSPYGILQLPINPFDRPLEKLTEKSLGGTSPTFVTHGIFGAAGGALDKLTKILQSRPHVLQATRRAGYTGTERETAAAMLVDFALESNSSGITLASLFRPEHLKFFCSRVATQTRGVGELFNALRLN